MRLVKYILSTLMALVVGLIIFMPKVELYYKGEELLNKYGVTIDGEEISSSMVSTKVLHPTIYFRGVDVARASVVDFKPYLFINSIKAEDIELLNVAKQFLKVDIDTLKANHSILKPFYIKLNIVGSFGVANGYIDLKSRVVHVDIIEPSDINSIKKFLKKGEKGWFYESNF